MLLPTLIIIDDFFDDPLAVRNMALALEYEAKNKQTNNYPGRVSVAPLALPLLDGQISEILQTKVTGAEGTVHGHCRITLGDDRGRSGVHADPTLYSGILYLSLPEHCRGGTEFFRHRRTGLERIPTDIIQLARTGYADVSDLVNDVINKDTLSPSKWERTLRVPMRFNRLILFNPRLFHNSGEAFGKTMETGRLVQLLFFDMASEGV